MSQAGWAAITSNGPGAVAWPPPAILWRINEAPNTQLCPANRQIGKRRPPPWEALSAPPEVGLVPNCDRPMIGKVQNINSFKLQRHLN